MTNSLRATQNLFTANKKDFCMDLINTEPPSTKWSK